MEQNFKRSRDVYDMVTYRIINQLKEGKVPWQKPWNNSGLPENMITRRPYRGVNVFLLAMLGYEKNYFITVKQLKEVGGLPKEGERPYMATYWKEVDPPESNEPVQKPVRLLRYYMVYNIAQCNGIPKDKIPGFNKPKFSIEGCKAIIEGMPNPPEFRNDPRENEALYNPQFDYISILPYESFKKPEGYYGVLFHELIHSTGHASRLKRPELMQMAEFGSYAYSLEELTGEIGACYLKSFSGILQKELKNSVAYLQGWIAKLNENPRLIVYAATQAQKAVDYVLNIKYDNKEIITEEEATKI